MQTLIKNVVIVDGSNSEPYLGNVIINDHAITDIKTNLCVNDIKASNIIIDGDNNFIAPGFIDMHSHSDLMFFVPMGLQPKIMQGITTEVIGQCGFSVAPMPIEKQDNWRRNLILGNPNIRWTWSNFKEYFSALTKHGLECNLVPFVGHGTLRYVVNEDRSQALHEKQISGLCLQIEEAFAAGVHGLSFGLIYPPAIFADNNELEQIVRIAVKCKGIITIHLRSESDELLEALEEITLLVQKYTGILHISHLKAMGRKNWHKLDLALEFIEKNNLTFDHYPYTAGMTSLLSLLPPFVLEGDCIADVILKLQDKNIRSKIAKIYCGLEQLERGTRWDNLPLLVGWQNICIQEVTREENRQYLQRSLQDIAEATLKNPADALMDLIISEGGQGKMIDYYAEESSIFTKLNNRCGMIGSDSLFCEGIPHPRVYGTFPKIIGDYVFKKKELKLETAIHQMTKKPADFLGIKNRGLIKPGYKADLVIFDKDFKNLNTYCSPQQYPIGMKYVIINGIVKVANAKYLDSLSGEVI